MSTKPHVAKISKGGTTVLINEETAQSFSLLRKNPTTNKEIEVFGNGGAPGAIVPKGEWSNTTLVGFPFLGAAPDDKILAKGETKTMTKHGVARHLPWAVVEEGPSKVVQKQVYQAGTKVPSKRNSEGEVLLSEFPWSYELTVTYALDEEGAFHYDLTIKNLSDESMPVAPGLHPAFKTVEKSIIRIFSKGELQNYLITDEIEKDQTIEIGKSDTIEYKTPEYTLTYSHDFGQTTVWRSEGGGTVAFEPSVSNGVKYANVELSKQPDFIIVKPGETVTFKSILRVSA